MTAIVTQAVTQKPERGGTGQSHCKLPLDAFCASALSLPGFLPAQAPKGPFWQVCIQIQTSWC